MAALNNILQESWDYYRDLENRIKSRLSKLPSGSILKRKIGRQYYYYLKIRNGKNVLSKYLGRKRPEGMEKAIQERRLLKKQLREVKHNLRLLDKIYGRKKNG